MRRNGFITTTGAPQCPPKKLFKKCTFFESTRKAGA
jgi:hypothetical protein